MTDFVTIARITKTRGVRGEVAAFLLTDFPDRFSEIRQVHILREGIVFREVLEDFRVHRGGVILKFEGRDRPHEVEELVGGSVQIPQDQRVSLPDDSYYQSDLIGCEVFEGDVAKGHVVGLFETGPEGHNLVVAGSAGEEYMIPLARRFVDRVDVSRKRIEVRPVAGLREATLTEKSPGGRRSKRRPRAGQRQTRSQKTGN